MTTFVILGFCAVCFCLVGIGLSLDSLKDTLEYIAKNVNKGGED